LKRFRRPYRLITGSDFEEVLRIDFNEFQERAQAPDRILRAIALMNRRPTAPAQPAAITATTKTNIRRPSVTPDERAAPGKRSRSTAFLPGVFRV